MNKSFGWFETTSFSYIRFQITTCRLCGWREDSYGAFSNLDSDEIFTIFVTKMMKIDENFCEIDQICYNLKTEF